VVIIGMLASGLAASLAGFTRMASLMPLFLIEVALIILFSVSYLLSRHYDGEDSDQEN
jgi:hypothetical protein